MARKHALSEIELDANAANPKVSKVAHDIQLSSTRLPVELVVFIASFLPRNSADKKNVRFVSRAVRQGIDQQCRFVLVNTGTKKDIVLPPLFRQPLLPLRLWGVQLRSGPGSCVTDSFLSYIPNSVQYLKLIGSLYVTSQGLAQLPTSITHLELRNFFHKDAPMCFSHLTNLTDILIDNHRDRCLVNRDVFKNLFHFGALKRFEIHGQSSVCLTDKMIECLPQTLSELVFHGFISQNGIRHLPKSLTSLQLLHSSANISDAIPFLPIGLQYLDLGHVTVTDKALAHLPANLVHLSIKVNFPCEYCRKISVLTNAALQQLPPQLQSLEALMSHGEITDQGLSQLPQTLNKLILQSLRVTDKGLQQLPLSLTHLTVIRTKINGEGLRTLTNLRSLALVAVPITNESLLALESLPQLRTLDLPGCYSLTNDCCKYLPKFLRKVKISQTSQVTGDIVEMSKGFCPDTEVEYEAAEAKTVLSQEYESLLQRANK